MSDFNLFESLKNVLEEALEHHNGKKTNVKIRKVRIEQKQQYSEQDIKNISLKAKRKIY